MTISQGRKTDREFDGENKNNLHIEVCLILVLCHNLGHKIIDFLKYTRGSADLRASVIVLYEGY